MRYRNLKRNRRGEAPLVLRKEVVLGSSTPQHVEGTCKVLPRTITEQLAISVDLPSDFLAISRDMRLLVEILIIGVVIYFGWDKPFKEYAARANKTVTTKLDGLSGTLQKHEDPSVRRH